jgi:aminomethyltransferase
VALRRGPLDAEHRALDARMAEFGGWEMPIQYGGVLEEHRACRDRAVVFDVSHLGSLRVRGARAFATLQWAFTNDLERIEPGRAQYTHLLDVDDAHVVDDLIVWWLAPGDFLVMPNASNTEPLVTALRDAAAVHGAGVRGAVECTVDDVTRTRAVLAVQGPAARQLLGPVLPDAAAAGRFTVRTVEYPGGESGWAAGTGYTGEDGVELHVPVGAAVRVWHALLEAGIAPAGLGARDTLRLEAGLPLHGHELGPGITPFQAGLGWVVRFDKGDFRGRAALEREKERGTGRRLRGLVVDGRQIPREGCAVLRGDETIGTVTSGNFSPVLERGIALAFVPAEVAPGDALTVDVRGRRVPATVTEIPFVRR